MTDPKRPMYDGLGTAAIVIAIVLGMTLAFNVPAYIDHLNRSLTECRP